MLQDIPCALSVYYITVSRSCLTSLAIIIERDKREIGKPCSPRTVSSCSFGWSFGVELLQNVMQGRKSYRCGTSVEALHCYIFLMKTCPVQSPSRRQVRQVIAPSLLPAVLVYFPPVRSGASCLTLQSPLSLDGQ